MFPTQLTVQQAKRSIRLTEFDRYYQELENAFDTQRTACYLTFVTAVLMEQEGTVEQGQQDTLVPSISQPIILGNPQYLAHKTTRSITSPKTRHTIFEYLKQIWSLDTSASTIAKEKRELGQPLYQRELDLLNLHEGKQLTQNRWNDKSPFKRQRRN